MVSCSQQACLRGAVAAVLLRHVLHGCELCQVFARDCADAALGPELACAGVAREAAGQMAGRACAGKTAVQVNTTVIQLHGCTAACGTAVQCCLVLCLHRLLVRMRMRAARLEQATTAVVLSLVVTSSAARLKVTVNCSFLHVLHEVIHQS